MTDETDERMDRATRIRRMREGQRARSDVAGTNGATGPHETGATDRTETGDEPAESTDEAAGTDKALAVARRAAQTAAQVTGSSTETPVESEDGTSETVTAETTATVAGTTAADSSETTHTRSGGVPAGLPDGPTGVELPNSDSIQAAVTGDVLEPETGSELTTGRALDAQEQSTTEETVRVLEFTLGGEHYCLDITHVEEIVKRGTITRVPNTPDYVEGVVDLRGQITTILDPKRLLDIDRTGSETLLVVFSPDAFDDQGAIGWVVDGVRQVVPVASSDVNEPPVDDPAVEGIVDRDDEDEFVIWTNPDIAIRQATADGDGNVV